MVSCIVGFKTTTEKSIFISLASGKEPMHKYSRLLLYLSVVSLTSISLTQTYHEDRFSRIRYFMFAWDTRF